MSQSPWAGPGAQAAAYTPAGALGRVESSYNGASGGITALAILCGIGAIICAIAASADASNSAGWLTFAVVSGLIGLFTGISASNRSQSRIDIHERGLSIKRGSKMDSFRYEEVTNVWYRGRQSANSSSVTTSLFSLELNSGRRVAVEAAHYKNENELANTLFRHLTASLLAKALLDLQAGKRLSFGAIQVDRFGVSNGRETLPWSEVSGVRASGGNITINRQGKWLSWAQISTERTPNVLVLLVIADAIKGVKVP